MISFVIPVLNEASTVDVLYSEICRAIVQTQIDFEIIFVCDPSEDGTEQRLEFLEDNDKRVRCIYMADRAGQTECIRAGYEYSNGDAVITMDSDLQDPPELLVEMIESWQKGNLIVHTRRVNRSNDSFIYRNVSNIGYRFLSWISNGRIKHNVGDFRLVDKSVLPLILSYKDPNPFWRGITSMSGLPSEILTHKRAKRHSGSSKYGKRLGSPATALRGMASFSNKPLEFLQTLGVISLGLSIFAISFTLFAYSAFPNFPRGVPTIITLLSLFFGIQFFSTSIIATYMIVLIEQTRRRPNYLKKPKLDKE